MATGSNFWQNPIDLKCYLDDPTSEAAKAECKKVAAGLKNVGALVFRDPRVPSEENDKFIDQMEAYFEQPESVRMIDTRPKLFYQVGATPEGTELPRCAHDPSCHNKIAEMPEAERPYVPSGPDKKWRFFHRLGERPTETEFQQLNAPAVIPKAFPNWVKTMDHWGGLLRQAGETVLEMAAIGLGLKKDSFTKLMKLGPHLLAPTGSDLNKHNKVGDILAGYHQDLNILTVHGKSRFPALSVWQRNGTKMAVSIPDGCLLCQAAMQLEYLTGGDILAGFHEVVVNEKTLAKAEQRKSEGKSLWRISSTAFLHTASDNTLEPLSGTPEEIKKKLKTYPPLKAGLQVQRELEKLTLAKE